MLFLRKKYLHFSAIFVEGKLFDTLVDSNTPNYTISTTRLQTMIKHIHIILVYVFLTSCNTSMKKFDWLAGGCAPKNYLIDSYVAGYIFEDGSSLYIPISYQGDGGGWGSE